MSKKEFETFQEEVEYDYHRYKEQMRKRQKIKFIAALPVIVIMALGIIILMAFSLFGIIGRFIFM